MSRSNDGLSHSAWMGRLLPNAGTIRALLTGAGLAECRSAPSRSPRERVNCAKQFAMISENQPFLLPGAEDAAWSEGLFQ